MKKDYSCQNDIKITVKENNKIRQINIGDISYIKCDSYVSTIHFIDADKSISITKLLKRFEIELSEFGFIRANRSCLVNVRYIKSIEICKNTKLTLVSDENISISVRQLPKIKKIKDN
jgi:two-component system LytT family response regulator